MSDVIFSGVHGGSGGTAKYFVQNGSSRFNRSEGLSNRLKLSEGICCVDYHPSLSCLAIGSTRQLHIAEIIPTASAHEDDLESVVKRTHLEDEKYGPESTCHSSDIKASPRAHPSPYVLRNAGVFGGLQKVENVCWYPCSDEATIAFVQPSRCITIFLDALLFKSDGNIVSQQWTRTRGKGKFLQASMEAGGGPTSAAVVNGVGGAEVCTGATPMTTASVTSYSTSVLLHGGVGGRGGGCRDSRLPHVERGGEGLPPPAAFLTRSGTPAPDWGGRMTTDNLSSHYSNDQTYPTQPESGPAASASVQRPVKGLHAKELIELVIPVSFMRIKKIVWDPHTPYTLALTSPTTSFELWQIPMHGNTVYAPRLVLRPPAHGLRRLVNDIAFAPTDVNCIVVVAELANGGQILLYDRRQVEVPRCIDTSGPGLIAAFHPLFTDLLAVCFRQQKTRPECQIMFLCVDEGGAREAVSPCTLTEPDENSRACRLSSAEDAKDGRAVGGVGEGGNEEGYCAASGSSLTTEGEGWDRYGHDAARGVGGPTAVMQQGVLPCIQYYATVVRLQWRPSSRRVLDADYGDAGPSHKANSNTLLLSQLWLATLATTTDVDINVWDATNALLPVGTVKCAARDGKEPVDFVWINELTLVAVFQSGEVCVTSLLCHNMPTPDDAAPPHREDGVASQQDSKTAGVRTREACLVQSERRTMLTKESGRHEADGGLTHSASPQSDLAVFSSPSSLLRSPYPLDTSTEVFSLYTILPTCVVVCGLFGHILAIRNSVTQLRAHYVAVVRRECQELLSYLAEHGRDEARGGTARAGRACAAASSRLSDRNPPIPAIEVGKGTTLGPAHIMATTEGPTSSGPETSQAAASAAVTASDVVCAAIAPQTGVQGKCHEGRSTAPEAPPLVAQRTRVQPQCRTTEGTAVASTRTCTPGPQSPRATSVDATVYRGSTLWSRLFGHARRDGARRGGASAPRNTVAACEAKAVSAVVSAHSPAPDRTETAALGPTITSAPTRQSGEALRSAHQAATPGLRARADRVTRYGPEDVDSKFQAAMQELRATEGAAGRPIAHRFREVAAIVQGVQNDTASSPVVFSSSSQPCELGPQGEVYRRSAMPSGADGTTATALHTGRTAGSVQSASVIPGRVVRPVIESFVPSGATAGWGYVERAEEAANFTRYALKWDMGYELALGMRRWRHKREDSAAAVASAVAQQQQQREALDTSLVAPTMTGGPEALHEADTASLPAEGRHDESIPATVARHVAEVPRRDKATLRHNPHLVDLRFAEMMLHNARVCSEASRTVRNQTNNNTAAAYIAGTTSSTQRQAAQTCGVVLLHGDGGQAQGSDDPRGQWWRAAAHAWRSHAVDVIVALTVGQLEYGALVGDVQYCLVLYILFCLWWRLRHAESPAAPAIGPHTASSPHCSSVPPNPQAGAAGQPPCPLMPDPVAFRSEQTNHDCSAAATNKESGGDAATSSSGVSGCSPAEWKLRALQWLEAYTGALYARRLYVPLNELLLILPEITQEPCNPVQPRAADIAYEKQMTYVYCGHCPRSELRALAPPSHTRHQIKLERASHRRHEYDVEDCSSTTCTSSDAMQTGQEKTIRSCEAYHDSSKNNRRRHNHRQCRRTRHEETCLMCSAAVSPPRSTPSSPVSLSSSAELHPTYGSESDEAFINTRTSTSDEADTMSSSRSANEAKTTRSDDGSAATTASCVSSCGTTSSLPDDAIVASRVDIAVPHNAVCRRCHNPSAMACVICGEVVEGMYYWMRSCGHGGHVHHIQEWLSVSNECPRCGVAITTSAIERRDTQLSYAS